MLNWSLGKIALGPLNLINTNWAVFIAFCYIWLPYMVIPVYAALDRIPGSMIEASQDLGGRTWRTTRSVILPLALPGIVAGLDLHVLADARRLHHPGAARRHQLGLHRSVAYDSFLSNNVPLGAAMAIVPIAIMICYLLGGAGARRVQGAVMESTRAADRAARLGRAGPAVPVPADPADRDLRVRPGDRGELADPGLHAALVLGRLA